MENDTPNDVIYDDTWRYYVAHYFNEVKPQTTSSCRVFWRALAMTIPVYLVSTIVAVVLLLVGLLFAHYPAIRWAHGLINDIDMQEIPRWPKFRERTIWPITVMFIVAIPLGFLGAAMGFHQIYVEHPGKVRAAIGILLVIIVLVSSVSIFTKSDIWMMSVERYEDWKAKRCRILTVKKRTAKQA